MVPNTPKETFESCITQCWYGEKFQVDYQSCIVFQSSTPSSEAGKGYSILGPFGNIIHEEEVSYDTLAWRDLPITNERYRVALGRASLDEYGSSSLRIYMQQKFRLGCQSASRGVDAFVRIRGFDSRGKEVFKDVGKAWKFSDTSESKFYGGPQFVSGDEMIPLDRFRMCKVGEEQYLTLIFEIREPAHLEEQERKFPGNILDAMGRDLTLAHNGDVELVFRPPTKGQVKKLYALSSVLRTRCDYYSTMFSSSFIEGDKHLELKALSDLGSYQKRQIIIQDDFDLLHNILYFIYTDRVRFSASSDPPNRSSSSTILPNISPVEHIYMAADRMLLSSLRTKALDFLSLTNTINNITSRIMSPFADLYAEVSDMYAEYFREHWEEIKKTDEFNSYFIEMEERAREKDDPEGVEEILRVNERFRELMKDATFKKEKEPVGVPNSVDARELANMFVF